MNPVLLVLATASLLACQVQTIPASRLTGVVVTPDGTPVSNAFIELHATLPVGVEASPIEDLGTARSREDGSYEISFAERRVLVNAGERAKFGVRAFHFEMQPVMLLYDELPSATLRTSMAPRPDGDCALENDCTFLCSARLRRQCKAVSREYFGSEDVCDFRY